MKQIGAGMLFQAEWILAIRKCTLKKVILESGKYNLWKPYKIYMIIAASQRILK